MIVLIDMTWDDFENSVQFSVGEGLSVEYIVTEIRKIFLPVIFPQSHRNNLLRL